jgi:ubiquinone/menaquinone biosynthesis C-methylase UbiE
MSYALEPDREFARLEFQSSLPQYDYRVELRDLEIPIGARVLDAGTGSGIVARHLAERAPGASITGCDLSERRMARAREAARGIANLEFRVEDVRCMSFGDASFDVIVCRYVLQHLAPDMRPRALAELTRCLRPGGQLCVVDVDGAFTNVHPVLEPLPELIARLRSDDTVDLEVGRKLPSMLIAAGLSVIRTRLEPLYFRSDEGDTAATMLGWTLDAVQSYLAKLLGCCEKARAARRAYLDALRAPGGMFFCHKFIVTGQQPERRAGAGRAAHFTV